MEFEIFRLVAERTKINASLTAERLKQGLCMWSKTLLKFLYEIGLEISN